MKKFLLVIPLALVCVIAVEAAILVPRMRNRPNASSIPDASVSPIGESYLEVSSTDGLPGVATALQPAQKTYQELSTMQIATYIEDTTATEDARIALAQEKAEAKVAFLQRQRELALELAALQREREAASSGQSLNDPSLPGYVTDPGIYIVGDGGTLDNPSSLTQWTSGDTIAFDENGNPYVVQDGGIYGDGEYHYVPSAPGASLNDHDTPQTVTPTPDTTPAQNNDFADIDSYRGEFTATFVCTCQNCFDPVTYPASRLLDNFVLAPTSYLTPNTYVRIDGGLGGRYIVENGDATINGRNLYVFYSDHNLGGGVMSGYVKVYEA